MVYKNARGEVSEPERKPSEEEPKPNEPHGVGPASHFAPFAGSSMISVYKSQNILSWSDHLMCSLRLLSDPYCL